MMQVKNPVLKGFYPDPCILYVDKTFYVATSTFEWFPGVRIHESNNLRDWRLCQPSPLATKELLDMHGTPSSTGVWAPCLSYNAIRKKFFLTYSNNHSWKTYPYKDCNNYIIYADSVRGPWSKPVYVNSSGFDASLFHDDDGKVYYMNMEWDHRRAGKEQFSGILLGEYDIDKGKLVGEMRKIFYGSERGIVEGPHIYKRNGYYYLITAEGGTSYAHAVTVCRSKNIYGPYETHPNVHLLTSFESSARLQKAGHGSLCRDDDGNWYLAHLCSRPLQNGRCVLGRETAIQNIVWRDDWPYLKAGGIQPSDTFESPYDAPPCKRESVKRYTFDTEAFLEDFHTPRLPYSPSRYRIQNGSLVLTGKDSIISVMEQTALMRRQTDFCFRATTELRFLPESFQHMAGLLYRYDEENQYYLYQTFDEKKGKVLFACGFDHGRYFTLAENIPVTSDTVFLRVEAERESARFLYSEDGAHYRQIGQAFDCSILSDDYVDGFTGAFVGMGCQDLKGHCKEAIFHQFVYEGLDE